MLECNGDAGTERLAAVGRMACSSALFARQSAC
jgi:hypothetical protein